MTLKEIDKIIVENIENISQEKNSKTLVIHPYDPSTNFLAPIYSGHGYDVIRKLPSLQSLNYFKIKLNEIIENYDRIMMFGHGGPRGLFFPTSWNSLMIDKDMVSSLKSKTNVYVWCNANIFVNSFGLSGLNTGMIISELEEARYLRVNATEKDVQESNFLFAEVLKKYAHSMSNIVQEIKKEYVANNNPVIEYNQKNIFWS